MNKTILHRQKLHRKTAIDRASRFDPRIAEYVVALVCFKFDITRREIMSPSTRRYIVDARNIIWLLTVLCLKCTYQPVADYFNVNIHTFSQGVRRIKRVARTDPEALAEMNQILSDARKKRIKLRHEDKAKVKQQMKDN